MKQQARKAGGPADPLQAAADFGIDITQLRQNVARSVAECLRRHQIALDSVETVDKAKHLA